MKQKDIEFWALVEGLYCWRMRLAQTNSNYYKDKTGKSPQGMFWTGQLYASCVYDIQSGVV